MTKSNTKKAPRPNPEKPYPDFPLFAHNNKQWAKKIRGKLHYFGPWAQRRKGKMIRLPDDGWQVALDLYKQQCADLYAGRTPRVPTDSLTLNELCYHFLRHKKQSEDAGDIAHRTWQDYRDSCRRIIAVFSLDRLVADLTPEDFGMLRANLAETRGPVALKNEIGRCRVLFKFGYDQGLIDKPMRYGQSFARPSQKALRKARQANGKRLFDACEIRDMIDAAGVQLKAMILLGINCGFGNSDVGNLPIKALDLDAGWIDYPRPKTGVPRRCPLWPETIQALHDAIADRSKPTDKTYADLLFTTKYGEPWAKETSDNPVSKETAKLLRRLGFQRRGLGFYALRHSLQTIGDGARDPIATRAIMGHAEDASDMSAVYRELVQDDRLQSVVDHVHTWLFGEASIPKPA